MNMMDDKVSKEDSKKNSILEVDGDVLEILPNGICKVKLENGNITTAYLKGFFKNKKVKVYPKDRVKVEFSVLNGKVAVDKGRISFKYRNEKFGNRDPNAKRSVSSRKIRNRRH